MKKVRKVQQKTLKNKNLILISAVVLVVIAAAIIFGSAPNMQQLVTAANDQNTVSEAATFTTTGAELLVKDTTQSLPYWESVTLEPGRYNVVVETSTPVWIRVYDQAHFDTWQSTGSHGNPRTGTNLGDSDKVTSFNRNFDVGTGEGGTYYLLITGSGSSSIQLRITQILKF